MLPILRTPRRRPMLWRRPYLSLPMWRPTYTSSLVLNTVLAFVKRFLKYAFRIHDFGDKCYSIKPCLVIHEFASRSQLLHIPMYLASRVHLKGYPLGEDARFTDFASQAKIDTGQQWSVVDEHWEPRPIGPIAHWLHFHQACSVLEC